MSKLNKSRAEYIMNHYSNSKKDILVLAKHLDEHDKDLQQRLALKDLEIMRLREALEDADELIAIEPFEHVAQEAADAHYAIRQALSTPTTYDDLMAWHEAQYEKVAYMARQNEVGYLGFKLDRLKKEHPHVLDKNITPLYAKKG